MTERRERRERKRAIEEEGDARLQDGWKKGRRKEREREHDGFEEKERRGGKVSKQAL